MKGIVTGKTWRVNCSRQKPDGTARPFTQGQSLKAALGDSPGDRNIVAVAAEIIDGTGDFVLSLTDEQTVSLPEPHQFGTVKILWLDVDLIDGNDILPLIVNRQVEVRAGITKAGG